MVRKAVVGALHCRKDAEFHKRGGGRKAISEEKPGELGSVKSGNQGLLWY